MIPAGDLVSAMFRAYNDWLAEYCKPYPGRLRGLAMLNVDDVSEAVAELERAAKMGLGGAMIPVGPLEPPYYDPVYEPLWAAAQDLEMPPDAARGHGAVVAGSARADVEGLVRPV